MGENEKIARLVRYYARVCGTRDPFKIADQLGVLYQIGDCEFDGCYMFLKNRRYIFLSNRLEGDELRLVMAHELGHALLDRKQNCYFMRNKTLFSMARFERRANLFAAYLLIDGDTLSMYRGFNREQFCNSTGYPEELLELRLKQPMAF
jgi:Zn-dependent peptidase ImmA (M78 family)